MCEKWPAYWRGLLAEPIYSLAFVIRRIGEHQVGIRHQRELETLSRRATDVTQRRADSQRRGVLPVLARVERTGRDHQTSDGHLVLRQCRHSREGQCHQRQYRDDGDLPSAISARTAMMPIFLIKVFILFLVGL
jgi:hypothetical protein